MSAVEWEGRELMTETHVATPTVVSMALITGFSQASLVRINRTMTVATPVAGDSWFSTPVNQMTTFTGSLSM